MTKFIGTPLRGIEFANPGDEAISSRVSGDTQPRLRIDAGGRITWSDGTNSGDTVLFRSSANALTTYDSLTASAGLITLTTNGIPSQSLPNGAIAIDTTNHVFYFRSNNEWLEVSGGATVTVDDSPPLAPEIGDLWYSSLELELFIYYSNAWIQLTDAQGGVQELYELSDVLIDNPVYGQSLMYNGTEWENDFITVAQSLATARAISLSGDMSGSAAFDGSQNISISATIQPNSVALGTDTTGSYVQSLVAGTGVTLSNNSGESATPTIAIGQAVGTSASVSFAHVATDSLNVVNNVIGTGNITLSPNVSSYVIGDTGPAGGKIFITPSTSGNTTGKYFEAAPVAAQVLRKWATDTDPGIGLGNAATTVSGADGIVIGTGQQNTADIVAQTGNVAATSAAVYCDEYTYGGFSDWFLPSKDELNELYLNQVVIGGFISSYYSSSSEVSNEAFWFQSFIDGNPNTPYKNNAYYIRPVRSFVAPAPAGIITGNLTGNVTGNVTGNSSTATTLQTARTISLSGDVSGSVSFNGSANATISTAIQPNSVALGTDTTGNYMSALTQGTGVTITHTPSEGSNATIAIGQAVGTSASVTFANVTVTGDLIVSGTTTSINTETLTVDDNIIVLNNNATGAPSQNSGIEVERGSSANVALRWNETSDKWELTNDGSSYADIATETYAASLTPATLNDIGDVTITSASSGQFLKWDSTAWVNDAIDLGTDTTGNYMSDLTQGTGVTITHTPGEGSNATIAIGQAVGTSSSVQFAAVTAPVIGNASTATTLQTARTITLGGDLGGSVSFNGSSDVTLTATVAANSVALGTDTTGNYMSDLTQGTGVTITHTPGEGSNATIAIGQAVGTSASVTFANVTATGNVAISGRIDKTTVRESVADVSVSASVVTADYSTGDIFYVGTAPASNFTVNLTNAPTDNGKAITVVIFVTQGATGYIPNVVQVAGSAQTIKWANGAAPTPTSSAGKIDIFSFTFVRRSSAWTVFGSSNLGY